MHRKKPTYSNDQYYNVLFELSPDAIITTDSEGVIVDANHAFLKLTGLTKKKSEKKGMSDFFTGDTKNSFKKLMVYLQKGYTVTEFEITFSGGRDGSHDWEINAIPIKEKGTVTRIVFIAHDITGRKIQEKIWRTLSSIVESSDDAIIGKNLEGDILNWNTGAERVYGYTAEEMIGKSISLLIPPERLDELSLILDKLQKGERVDHFETVRVKKDGTRIDVSLTISPIKDEMGAIVGISTIARDITENKRLERELRESEERYRGLVESQRELIVRVTPEGKITFVNDAYCNKFGKTHEELIGSTFTPLVHEKDLAATLEAMKGLENPPNRIYLEQRSMTVEGWRWIAWEDYAIKDEQGSTIEIQGTGRDITERKEAERILRESERRLSETQKIVRLGTWELDSKTRELSWSDETFRIFGLEPRDSAPSLEKYLNMVHPDDVSKLLKSLKTTDKKGTPFELELRHSLHDGTNIYTITKGQPIYHRDRIVKLLGSILDITERKKAEIALSESQKKYQSVFDKANDYMVLLDTEGTVLEINEYIQSVMGYEKEEMVGKNIRELPFLTEEGIAKALSYFRKRIKGTSVSTYELEFVKRSGEVLIGEVNATLIDLGDGKIADLVVIRDITERKKAEEERIQLINKLEEKTDELNTILESIGDPIVCTDQRYIVTTVNRAFCELVGRSPEEIIGKPCTDILRCADNNGTILCDAECGLNQTMEQNVTTVQRSVIQNVEGRGITIDSLNSPLKSTDGSIIGAVKSMRDVSKEVEVEKMKNEFVSTVSHELRTPLTSIKGYVDLILDGDAGETTDLQKDFLSIISENTDRLTLIINDLLDIEKFESGTIVLNTKNFSLHDLVTRGARTIEPEATRKNLNFITRIDDDIEMHGDPARIMQILTNLISNAVKFTSHGTITIILKKRGGNAEISVRDTGFGISAADQKKLFTKFFRAENAQKQNIGGTGLGLSIVQSLVKLHNGSVSVKSKLNRGSEFHVLLPLENKPDDKK